MERQVGNYWVKVNGKWVIAEWWYRKAYPKGYYWLCKGRICNESSFEEIDENIIVPSKEAIPEREALNLLYVLAQNAATNTEFIDHLQKSYKLLMTATKKL